MPMHITGLSLQNSTGTSAAGAITLNAMQGVITTESLTTAAAAEYTLTLTNSKIAAADVVLVSIANGTNTSFPIKVTSVTPAAGSVVIKVLNSNAGALNGTIKVLFVVFKAV